MLQAPELQASTETMDKWLNSYRGALHQADPENGSTPGDYLQLELHLTSQYAPSKNLT